MKKEEGRRKNDVFLTSSFFILNERNPRLATYQIMYWHDIPIQVRARGEGGRASAALPDRFQEAIDQAAMAAGLIGSDDYSAALRWGEAQERAGAAREVADAVAAELDTQHPTIDWRATVARIRAEAQ
jgi:hypothetical protein